MIPGRRLLHRDPGAFARTAAFALAGMTALALAAAWDIGARPMADPVAAGALR